ncbi:MAG: hypothetical protein IKU34_06605 [Clostridia bacterium]|nr:hypothetical protein [Clostridia bacterium]
MVEFLESLYILLIVLAGLSVIAVVYATLNTLYYFIRDGHWSWKWWLSVLRDSFGFIFRTLNFFGSGHSSSGKSSGGSSGKSSGFGGGSSRGGGSGRSF